jgi:hypothetical protein
MFRVEIFKLSDRTGRLVQQIVPAAVREQNQISGFEFRRLVAFAQHGCP